MLPLEYYARITLETTLYNQWPKRAIMGEPRERYFKRKKIRFSDVLTSSGDDDEDNVVQDTPNLAMLRSSGPVPPSPSTETAAAGPSRGTTIPSPSTLPDLPYMDVAERPQVFPRRIHIAHDHAAVPLPEICETVRRVIDLDICI